jgi:chromosome segregation ATPase
MGQIEELKKERGVLRSTLDTFRREFERTNARKIKFKKDIKAVEMEFKRYKDLKEEINTLEKKL